MKIIIEGAGEVGSHLAKMLRAEGNDIVVIDNDAARLAQIELSADVQTIEGNPSSIAVLRNAGVAHADLVIAVYPSAAQEVNIVGALLAKQLGAAKVVARIGDEDYLTAENKLLFKELGIELMFYPEKIAADEIVDLLRHGSSSETLDFAHGRLQIAVFKVDENTPLLDLKLSEFTQGLSAEEAAQFRIIAISRSDKTIIPGPDTLFRYNDLVFTIARREGAENLVRHFGKKSLSVGRVLIVGGTAVAEMVARGLSRQGIEVKLIEKNRERCLELSDHLPNEVQVVNGDGRNSDFLYEEGIRDCDAFIALSENDESNVLSCVVAKKFGVPRTVAEVENIEYVRLAEEMGVDSVINKKLITAGRIFKFTLSGKARFVKYMSGTDAEVIEYTVAPGSAITKGPLKELDFPRGAIIGGVVRGSESFIAVGDTVIEAYDRVAVFALPETVREIDRFFK
ncbi:MAG: Trk system potassium transporter TrkA [Bacteroidales bacterium]|nr:Trk system potassium transporter TrkA [Bacteroidales bacterium]